MNEPMKAATIPMTIVSQIGMCCRPGTTSRPSAPITNPTRIAEMMPVIVMARSFASTHHVYQQPTVTQLLHLPRGWPWEAGLDELFRRALHDPLSAAARPPPANARAETDGGTAGQT